jgi:hypothetical protein
MVWSKIALDQILGRAHRFGQEKEVLFYLMVALGTVDVLMVDCGFAKGSLLRTFLNDRNSNSQSEVDINCCFSPHILLYLTCISVISNALAKGIVIPDEIDEPNSEEERLISPRSEIAFPAGSKRIEESPSQVAEERGWPKEILELERARPASPVIALDMEDHAVPSLAVPAPASPKPAAIDALTPTLKAAEKRSVLGDSITEDGPSSSKRRISTDSFPVHFNSSRTTRPRPTPLHRPPRRVPITEGDLIGAEHVDLDLHSSSQIEGNLIGAEKDLELDLAPMLQPPLKVKKRR